MINAFEDPSIKSAVGELEAAEAFFNDDDDANPFTAPPSGGFGGQPQSTSYAPPKQSLSGGFGNDLPRSDGVPPVAFTSGTLDETVGETLWRDASHVGGKLLLVLMPYTSNRETIEHLRDWDLWGPLIVSLTLATSLSINATSTNAAVVFSLVFVVLWAGAVVVTLNAQLLGGRVSLPQSVCMLGYSAFPVCAARLLIGVVETLVGGSRLVRFGAAALALVWATRASVLFVEEVIPAKRRALAVYPVFLFYSWLAWMVVVV